MIEHMNKCSYININIPPIHLVVNRYYEKIRFIYTINYKNKSKNNGRDCKSSPAVCLCYYVKTKMLYQDFFHADGENSKSSGKSSSLPASISKISTLFDSMLKLA